MVNVIVKMFSDATVILIKIIRDGIGRTGNQFSRLMTNKKLCIGDVHQ